MSQPSNKLTNLWQELKRRKVVRVVSVYAAAAFVILELVSIIVEPLKLPEWFLTMVIVLLCIGFSVWYVLAKLSANLEETEALTISPARLNLTHIV